MVDQIMILLIGVAIGFTIAYFSSYFETVELIRKLDSYDRLLTDYKSKIDCYIEESEVWHKRYIDSQVEMRNQHNRMNNLLQELSDALGIDELDLPSFGKLYLNRNKWKKEAMESIHLEDPN